MKILPDALIAAGLGIIVAGVAAIYPPAALILGGAFVCALGWQLSK
jgi:hypothetical protein